MHSDTHPTPSIRSAPPLQMSGRPVTESVGDLLQHARRERGMSLDGVARSTRISMAQLESIERGHYDELPGETYVRGFVRSYAKSVGLDADQALVTYASECRSAETTLHAVQKSTPKKSRSVGLLVVGSIFLLLLVVATLAVGRSRSTPGPTGISRALDESSGQTVGV